MACVFVRFYVVYKRTELIYLFTECLRCQVFRVSTQLLPNRSSTSRGRRLRHVILWWPRVLGHRRAVPGAVLPAPLPPAQRTRAGRDEERGGQSSDGARRGGLRRRSVGKMAATTLGSTRETADFHGSQGKLCLHFTVTAAAALSNTWNEILLYRTCALLQADLLNFHISVIIMLIRLKAIAKKYNIYITSLEDI